MRILRSRNRIQISNKNCIEENIFQAQYDYVNMYK